VTQLIGFTRAPSQARAFEAMALVRAHPEGGAILQVRADNEVSAALTCFELTRDEALALGRVLVAYAGEEK
jgi:hypothetical protein